MKVLTYRDLPGDNLQSYTLENVGDEPLVVKEMVIPGMGKVAPLHITHIEGKFGEEDLFIVAQTERAINAIEKQEILKGGIAFLSGMEPTCNNIIDAIFCPQCHYEYCEYDEEANVIICPRCDYEWYVGNDEDESHLDLGACCICNKEDETCKNMLMLRKKAHIPGTGWGCVVCNLPSDGASALLCDDCLVKVQNHEFEYPKQIIYGYAAHKQRIDFYPQELEDFDHDLSQHPEISSEFN